MQNQNIHYRRIVLLIALVLGCFTLSPALQADDHGDSAIVGLWHVHYFHGTQEWNQTYDQWHSDGLEFEVAGIAPGAMCQGTYTQTASGTIKLFHVAWTFDSTGVLNGYWEEKQTNTVSHNRKTYQGTYDTKFYDLSGNFLFEDTGTLTAERLPEHY